MVKVSMNCKNYSEIKCGRLDNQIDELYELYGSKDEEIKIVEGVL
jgi:hypothetical protein